MALEQRGWPSLATTSQTAVSGVDAYFAAVGRDGAAELQSLLALLRGAPLLQKTIDAMPIPVAIFNRRAQAVMMNALWGEYSGAEADCALGKRHGELLGCLHVQEGSEGCGTSRACGKCGAAISLVASQQTQAQAIREYRLDRDTPDGIESKQYMVASTPLEVGGQSFTILALVDLDPRGSSELRPV
jgi:PAS domain-containing protein